MNNRINVILKATRISFLFALIAGVYSGPLHSQNNGIFNGGFGTGYAVAYLSQADNNAIFQGNADDGYEVSIHTQDTNFEIFAGGTDDGYSSSFGDTPSNNIIFYGGIDDGYAYNFASTEDQNTIFAGGDADGYDIAFVDITSSNEIYAGGVDDGYSASGISKLIWTGAQSNDWLMADNWNVNRTPIIQDHVLIPAVETDYPFLTGKLLVGNSGDHTYTCHSIRIMTTANITGNGNAWLVNYGLIEIRGLLEFTEQEANLNQNLGAGVISIFNQGQLNIYN